MKSLIIIPFMFGLLSANEDCSMEGEETYCDGYNLKIDEPLQVNLSHKIMTIRGSTGSIGFETLSLLLDREYLGIVYSNISNIEKGALCSSPTMKSLHLLHNNEFPVLTESLLSNCTNIIFFSTDLEKLEPTAFKHMTRLEKLQLGKLKIPHITRDYFEPLKELKYLDLFDSDLNEVDPGVFCISPKLERLRLARNKWVLPRLTKSLFEGCENLQELRILNLWSYLNVEKEVFDSFEQLKVLQFYQLDIIHLTKAHFGRLSLLEDLDLGSCNINEIDRDAFEGFTNLKRLDISSNGLTYVNPSVFESLINLEELNMQFTGLSSIDNMKLPNLKIFDVKFTQISCINADSVHDNLPKLKKLRIDMNLMHAAYQMRTFGVEVTYLPEPLNPN